MLLKTELNGMKEKKQTLHISETSIVFIRQFLLLINKNENDVSVYTSANEF